jgi:DsbC/DsbD-like thiol-disulfide interchange protein
MLNDKTITMKFPKAIRSLLLITLWFCSYSIMAQQPTEAEIAEAAKTITLEATTREAPVAMNATLLKTEVASGEKAYAIVKINIEDSWHIYAYVPQGGYFIMSEMQLLSTNDQITTTAIEEPGALGYEADPNIMIYKGELIFVYEIATEGVSAGTIALDAVLNYQACDPYRCLPPSEHKKTLSLTVK